jgi:hypothetical protein
MNTHVPTSIRTRINVVDKDALVDDKDTLVDINLTISFVKGQFSLSH